jgi:hypothetical protein
MARSTNDNCDEIRELLQKLLVLQLHDMGASQTKIARVVGRQKLWVNELLKGIPRGD